VQSVATLTRIVPGSKKAVGLSQALFPSYSEIDPYNMAGAGIDTALRGLVAMGVPPDTIAILDNFCWCSSDEPERLGQLKLAAKGCYDFSKAFGTPFISGKDSMFNDFSGFDAEGQKVKVSVPPTLLISSIGVHPDAGKAVSMDAKIAGDLVYVIGGTKEELGGSEYFAMLGSAGNTVPELDAGAAKERYVRLANAIAHELVASAFPVNHGGLAVALAKVAVAGRLGMDLTVPVPDSIRPDYFLFSETLSRFVVTVAPDHKRAFEQALGPDAVLLGRTGGSRFRLTARTLLLDVAVADLETAYKTPFGRY
jgi:phosphoribosylformylglycinamidine synthase